MGRNTIKGGDRSTYAPVWSDAEKLRRQKLQDDRLREDARAGLPLGFVARMIGGRIARVGMKGVAKSVAKKAAMAAASHALQKQVEKTMDKSEPTAGRRSHAYAGVIPLEMRIG